MDVFKLAFETTVVGLLAFVWLGVATYLLFPNFLMDLRDRVNLESIKGYQAATGVGVLTVAYCLGSAILPIANQLVNDEHWPLTENAIRCQVFTAEAQQLEFVREDAFPKGKDLSKENWTPLHCSYWGPVFNQRVKETGRTWYRRAYDKVYRGMVRFRRLWFGFPADPTKQGAGEDEDAFARVLDDLEVGRDGQDRAEICDTAKSGKFQDTLRLVCVDLRAGNHKQALAAICDEQGPAKENTSLATKCDEFKVRKILTLFQHEEDAVLSQTPMDMERLKQLHERIVVLRGAVFSGFVLLLIFVFAHLAPVRGQSTSWARPFGGAVLAVTFMAFALFNGGRDLVSHNVFDIPVLESVLIVFIFFGLAVVRKGVDSEIFRMKRWVLLTLFFTGLAYGGWMWSEIIYDQQVMSSFAVMQDKAEIPKH
jgi:hypothetical protein